MTGTRSSVYSFVEDIRQKAYRFPADLRFGKVYGNFCVPFDSHPHFFSLPGRRELTTLLHLI